MATPYRKTTRIPRDRQIDLFGGGDQQPAARRPAEPGRRVFTAPDPEDIYLGNTPLRVHLEEAGLHEPLTVRRLLQAQDWSAFESRYARTGRAPYAPSAMMGLVLYGILQGVSSLRGLERLARRDLGCMWVSGGICPDHANIGRFITLQDDLIAGALFEDLTRAVLDETRSGGEQLAGDGTVMEAACSHYGLLKAEAAHEHAARKRREATSTPQSATAQRQAARAEQARDTLAHRAGQRTRQGKPSTTLRISAQEPEAMVQPLKRGQGHAPSYKPSILANEARVVVAQTVDPSREAGVLPRLLSQSRGVTGAPPSELLLDAGYFTDQVIDTALAEEISLLCPESRQTSKGSPYKHYPKSRFIYDEASDSYRCPAGANLTVIGRWQGKGDLPGYTLYGTDACGACAERAHCTRNRQGRRLKRYTGDTAKDALRQVMRQPRARRRFGQRQGMVEPVFSVLRGIQGLRRFRRRGLSGVQTEFALHVLAYNLGRAVAYRLYFALCLATTTAFRAAGQRLTDLSQPMKRSIAMVAEKLMPSPERVMA